MRLLIDTSGVQFRVCGAAKPRPDFKDKDRQATTRDGEPIWTVRLDAIEPDRETKETIRVEVAGEQPKVTFDGYAMVRGLARLTAHYQHHPALALVRPLDSEDDPAAPPAATARMWLCEHCWWAWPVTVPFCGTCGGSRAAAGAGREIQVKDQPPQAEPPATAHAHSLPSGSLEGRHPA